MHSAGASLTTFWCFNCNTILSCLGTSVYLADKSACIVTCVSMDDKQYFFVAACHCSACGRDTPVLYLESLSVCAIRDELQQQALHFRAARDMHGPDC